MPLSRFEVRNEYRLGDPELYKASPASRIKDGDSKALLDGVAVAGLVGILRQLGDLAEFAADMFHDLHEQVTATAARRRKLLSHIHNIETALPSVEKAIKEQKSHIHFAYVGGSDWHAHIRDDQNLLLSTELPRYMMDSYEECHDPPRLYLLDKFDHGGNGACLKRYSDPSYFRRVWPVSESEKADNTPRKKKTHTMKRKGSCLRDREFQHGVYMSWQDSRISHSNSKTRFASPSMDGHSSENSFTEEIRSNLEPSFQSTNFGSKARESYAQQASDVNSEPPDNFDYLEVSDSVSQRQDDAAYASHTHIKPSENDGDDILNDSAQEHSVPRSSSVTWDEKTEIIAPAVPSSHDGIDVSSVQDSASLSLSYEFLNMENSRNEAAKDGNVSFGTGKEPVAFGRSHFDEVTSDADNFMDALNTMESETETEAEDVTKPQAVSPSIFSGVSESQIKSKQDKVVPKLDMSDNRSLEASLLTIDQDVFPKVSSFSSELSGCLQPPVVSLAQSQEFSITNGSSECNIHEVPETKDHEPCDTVRPPQPCTPHAQVMVQHQSAEEKSDKKSSLSNITSGLPTVQLWTNGVLFGVEPSKPPDLGLVNVSSEKVASDLRYSASKVSSYMIKPRTLAEDKSEATLMHNANSSKNFDSLTYYKSSNDSQLSLSVHDVQQNDSSQCSPSRSDAQNSSNLKQCFLLPSQPLSSDRFQKNHETSSVNGPPSTNFSDVGLNGSSRSTGIMSSAFSDLAHRFLANTLQRKTLVTSSFTSESSYTTNGNKKIEETHEKDQHVLSGADSRETSRQSTCENAADRSLHKPFSSSHYSGTSSPPLEHMKISFLPMNGMETSKVKQNISSSCAHESTNDFLFPIYRMCHGPIDAIQDNLSESDDDTFCKSYPYSSDEPLSPGSSSNPDLWDQDERNEHNINEMFDTLNMASVRMDYLTKSLSSEMQSVDVEGHEVPVVSGSSVSDLPNLDSILSARKQQEGACNLPNGQPCSTVREQDQPPPLPPSPPPPSQWTILRQSIGSPMDSDANAADKGSHLVHSQTPKLSSEQPEHSAELPSIFEKNELKLNGEELNHVGGKIEVDAREELLHEFETKKYDQQILNGHNNLYFDTTTCKEVVERDELLHQIRNKSFNLRRTVTSKPRALPCLKMNVANSNVAAILEKATAIRQAFVSSDEAGDDENWSDG